MSKHVVWVDSDAADFGPVTQFFREYSIKKVTVNSITEAVSYLSSRSPISSTCILLDALVPIGFGAEARSLIERFEHDAEDARDKDVTGYWLLQRLGRESGWYEKTVVLSAYSQNYLTERGFPDDIPYFHKESLAGSAWDTFCKEILIRVGSPA